MCRRKCLKSRANGRAMMRIGVILATAVRSLPPTCRARESRVGTLLRPGDAAGQSGLHPPEPPSDRLKACPRSCRSSRGANSGTRQVSPSTRYTVETGRGVTTRPTRRGRAHCVSLFSPGGVSFSPPPASLGPLLTTSTFRALPGNKEGGGREQVTGSRRRSGGREPLRVLLKTTSAWIQTAVGVMADMTQVT